ncbi:hypothetical protein D1007_00286 [Hordeum vulgare]|nr:hypothetical protein D1007_00286 [Hordeum vulgare]
MSSPDTSASLVSSAATSSATSPASSSFAAAPPTAMTYSSAATPPPFIFGTASGSQFAPLFSSGATISPAAPAAAPRHPIFGDHITNHIKFLLNPADHNYHKWKTFFLMVFLRYGVSYLTEQPPPPNAPPAYLELDAHVVLWIYATHSDTMCDHVIGAATTFALWHKIKDFFLANRAARYMSLNRQYLNLKQGDLSVSEYARRMKLLTDGLADIDHASPRWTSPPNFFTGWTSVSTPSASSSAIRISPWTWFSPVSPSPRSPKCSVRPTRAPRPSL